MVDLSPCRKTVGNKWVLNIKHKAYGTIDKYKARLVAKGYTDYEETFSHVVRFASIRLILAIVERMDLELYQIDIKTAFLNEELDEEIYIDQPLGFELKGQECKVCKLKRSIYGLKQALRQWNLKFHQAILEDCFTMMEEDHCMYIKRSNNYFIILSLYVDDILIAGNDKKLIDVSKRWLSSNFKMKDMGEANYLLGVKILKDRSKRLLGLSQETCIKKMLKHHHMPDCKLMDTPVERNLSLSLDMCPKTPEEKGKMSKILYSSAVGSLMYAMMCTHSNIRYAVGLVSRFQSNPGIKHWMTVKRIMRYLKGIENYVLCYQGKDLQLIGYTDTDWGGDPNQHKSTSGCTFLLNDCAISWCSKKQSCIALSMMEVEYVACSSAIQEAIWLKIFLQDLEVIKTTFEPMTLYCDSMATLAYAN